MSKIGNHRVGMQETDDYRFGWESADRGEPMPEWDDNDESFGSAVVQQLGWKDWHTENGQFGVGA